MIASPQLRAPRVLSILCVFGVAAGAAPMGAEAQIRGALSAAVGERSEEPAARAGEFLKRQLRYPRVRQAFERKAESVEAILEAGGVENVDGIFFRVFKREQELELWVREADADTFALLKSYPVCAVSGELGPKRQQGDLQVPEGFYDIDVFNPASRYHLSMRVNYPNRVDRRRSAADSPGGDIYIHGGCATIGCVPVTDDYIEEIYLVAAAARDAGQRRIPVHIFPTRLDRGGLEWLENSFGDDGEAMGFWRNLGEGYRSFEATRVVPRIGYDGDRYTFAPPRSRKPLGEPTRPILANRAPTLLQPPVPTILGVQPAGATVPELPDHTSHTSDRISKF